MNYPCKSMKVIQKIHRNISEKYFNVFYNTFAIYAVLFHKIFPSKGSNLIENRYDDVISTEKFEEIICYFKKRNFNFISPADIVKDEIDYNRNNLLITFDDGFKNNDYALEILEKHKIKGTFFISTQHIINGKSFWWDVILRERQKSGLKKADITGEIASLYTKTWIEQEDYLVRTFGTDSLYSDDELEKPMTPEELRQFSRSPYAEIGNHTDHHLNLTVYNEDEIIQSVKHASDQLQEITGKRPISLSYPYGFYNEKVISAVAKTDISVGITVDSGKTNFNQLKQNQGIYKIRRNHMISRLSIEEQCYHLYNGYSIAAQIKKKIKR